MAMLPARKLKQQHWEQRNLLVIPTRHRDTTNSEEKVFTYHPTTRPTSPRSKQCKQEKFPQTNWEKIEQNQELTFEKNQHHEKEAKQFKKHKISTQGNV